jgi:N-acetylglucosaminyldiphosphoundecaprenol N-acetyl-beta-D-mannosaminyltransferase
MAELNDLLEQCLANGLTSIIANHNLHSLCLYHQDAKIREFYAKADCAHTDGMGVVFLAKLLGKKITREQRVTYVDWVPSLMEMAARREYRIFYLGSKPGVALEAAERLRRSYPYLVIDTTHGFFDVDPKGAENQAILERIQAFEPNILMVGMGMPRQEYWVLVY